LAEAIRKLRVSRSALGYWGSRSWVALSAFHRNATYYTYAMAVRLHRHLDILASYRHLRSLIKLFGRAIKNCRYLWHRKPSWLSAYLAGYLLSRLPLWPALTGFLKTFACHDIATCNLLPPQSAVNLHLIRAQPQKKKTRDKIKTLATSLLSRRCRSSAVVIFTFFVLFTHNWHACYLCISTSKYPLDEWGYWGL